MATCIRFPQKAAKHRKTDGTDESQRGGQKDALDSGLSRSSCRFNRDLSTSAEKQPLIAISHLIDPWGENMTEIFNVWDYWNKLRGAQNVWWTKAWFTPKKQSVRSAADIFKNVRCRGLLRIHDHCFMPLSSPPPVAAAAGVAWRGPALAAHLLQEADQAGTAALPMLVAAQGLHTAEGLRLGGWKRLEEEKKKSDRRGKGWGQKREKN